jgi:hypothetical protein
MSSLAKVALSLGLAFVLMVCWVGLANIYGWGAFTGWGMAHGGFVLALPVCLAVAALIVFVGARVLSSTLRASERRGQRHW